MIRRSGAYKEKDATPRYRSTFSRVTFTVRQYRNGRRGGKSKRVHVTETNQPVVGRAAHVKPAGSIAGDAIRESTETRMQVASAS